MIHRQIGKVGPLVAQMLVVGIEATLFVGTVILLLAVAVLDGVVYLEQPGITGVDIFSLFAFRL